MSNDLYGQERDLMLLLKMYGCLANKAVIDVGAEKGSFVEAFLEAGCREIYVFEPYPPHANHLRERFGSTAVHVFETALGFGDGTAIFHIAEDASGRELDYHHSLVAFGDGEEVRWRKTLSVQCRSLGSLVEEGAIPAEVGILKIDTEGNDFAVIQGLGRLRSAVIMVEYWTDLPAVYGECPYSLADMAEALRRLGYSNFAIVKRHDEFRALQINCRQSRPGDWGNALFIHDGVFSELAPILFEAVADLQTELIDKALEFRRECHARLEVIEQLQKVCQERLENIRQLQERRLSSIKRIVYPLLEPRLGLHQYPARPLKIPRRYRQTRLPKTCPVISLVTPTLNSMTFLERTLRSVISQGYSGLEYIVQDGGSTDGTVALLGRYEGCLAAMESAKDEGQSDALNRGFRKATGEILGYLNSDDLLLPGALAYVARFFHERPEVDVLYGHRVLIDEDDWEIGRWVLPSHDDRVLAWADYIPQETLFWRRAIWEKAGARLDESFQFALDWDLVLRFRDAGARFARVPRFLGAFRVHAGQKTVALMAELGEREMNRIREREHGRPVSHAMVARHVRRYLLRHVVYQRLYRLGLLRY